MYSFELVLQVLEYYNKFLTDRKIEQLTGVSKSTCNKWKKDYFLNYYNLLIRHAKQHKDIKERFLNSLSENIFDYVKKIVEDNPFMNYKMFITLINKKFNIKLNNKKMKFLLESLNITKKRIRQRVIKSELFLNKIIEERKKFVDAINKEIIDDIICIDESAFNKLIDSNTKGYSAKGIEINIPVHELKMKNTSLLMAFSVYGILNHELTLDNINTDFYFKFIKNTIEKLKLNHPNKKFIFIYDNVSFHQNRSISDFIINSGHKLYNVPAYSPNLNPIENVFGILKSQINDDIINEMNNNNLFNNYDKTKKENNEDKKQQNKQIRIEEKNKEKTKIAEFKIKNKNVYCVEINTEINKLKTDINIDKNDINNKIKIIKSTYKKEKKKREDEYISKLKDETKKEIFNKKIKRETILKKIIENNILKFNQKYNRERIIKIYNHAFTYNHENIEKELRDRIKIKK